MTSALLRQPRGEKTPLARLASAYGSLERALAELEAINLSKIPRNSPVREAVKTARQSSQTALESVGSSLKQGSTLRPPSSARKAS